jgi:hypothetical protein
MEDTPFAYSNQQLCIFCKQDSARCKSNEHIWPQSYGNTKHTVPPGIVCDTCNNYFSRKVEGPLLASGDILMRRFAQYIPNKRGRVPEVNGLHYPSGVKVTMTHQELGLLHITPDNPADIYKLRQSLLTSANGAFIGPERDPPSRLLMSRLLAKAALEALALRVSVCEGWQEHVIFKEDFDDLRNHARSGASEQAWPYSERQIYQEDDLFLMDGDVRQIINEYDLLYTPGEYMFFTLAILGREYIIDMVNPSAEGYDRWLSDHDMASPLYPTGIPVPVSKTRLLALI